MTRPTKNEPPFCYKHGEIKHNGKCPKCVWAGENTPNADLEKAAARSDDEQKAQLMSLIFG